MSAPARFRGVFDTVPGRATINVRVPLDLLGEAERIAHELGVDRAVVLGDLVASALPAALAEAADDLVGAPARERLAGCLLPDAERPRAIPGACSDFLTIATTVEPDVTGSDLDDEGAPGGVGG